MKHSDGAAISSCNKYRYRLDRWIGEGRKVVAFFGINPSTADASTDDATVRKWRGFSKRMKAERFIVGNVFSYRATDISDLRNASDVRCGPLHQDYLDGMIQEADILVPCWGNTGKLGNNKEMKADCTALMNKLIATNKPVLCFGYTKSGDPKHPLMLSYSTLLEKCNKTN